MTKPATQPNTTDRPRQVPPIARRPQLVFTGGGPPAHPERLVSNAVLATLIFVVAEAMLFGGLISAFTIASTSALGAWPPPGQPRLPVEETAINTAALLLSGVLIYFANRAYRHDPVTAKTPLALAIGLGAFFVAFQGMEWLALIREGLTLTSSNHGSFFYLIVGTHALHAIAALIALIYVWDRLRADRLDPSRFHASQIFWYFVVGLWPLIYVRVYL